MIRASLVLLSLLTLITGLVYPLLTTAVAQMLFPRQANGSLEYEGGRLAGSTLIGRPFDDPKYFWPRPSATAPFPYNAAASSGSNLGPGHPDLAEAIAARRAALLAADPDNHSVTPADLLMASASGLDPDISPQAAYYQAPRVARARGIDPAQIRALVARHTAGRQFGVLGEPRVNVAALNRALDRE